MSILLTQQGGGGGDLTLALTGVSATGAIGALAVSLAIGLTGVAGTASAGSVAPSSTTQITGILITSAVGTFSPALVDIQSAISGASATGAIDSVTPSSSPALVGVSATGAVDSVAPSKDIAVTGVAATGDIGSIAPDFVTSLSGEVGTTALEPIVAGSSKALVGILVTSSAGSVFAPAVVTVALTGVSATGVVHDVGEPGYLLFEDGGRILEEDGVPPVPPPGAGIFQPSGGYGFAGLPPLRTKEQERLARKRFGICDDRVPVKVCKVIAQVAERKIEDPDLALDAALHRALEKKALAYRAYYAEVLRQEIARIQQEDEEIAILLLLS